MDLHLIGLGGSVQGANIEVHDLQIVLGDTLEDCLEHVKHNWYGDSLHIDSDTVIREIDGYDISYDGEETKHLYLIVYGGYKSDQIDEVHTYDMILADSKQEAKQLAKQSMSRFSHIDHVDNVVDVFASIGRRFALVPNSESKFTNNKTTHTFLKLITV